jgi:hypothetical protein
VLPLRGVAALGVAQGRIGSDDALIYELFECEQVALLALVIEPATTERERAVLVVDVRQQLLGRGRSERGARVRGAHVVTALQVLVHHAATRGAEGLDGVLLVLLHLGVVVGLDDGHALARVYHVGIDRVAVEVLDRFHLVHLAAQLDLVALHHLLNALADLAQSRVYAREFDARVGRLFHRVQQRIVHGIERHRECAVDNVAVDVHAKVHFHHIGGTQHRLSEEREAHIRNELDVLVVHSIN